MSHEAKIHSAQISILRELLFVPVAGFAALQKPTGLDSDHFKFHIARLVELGYVTKTDKKYALTQSGKEYANKLDTDNNTIERQPKAAVILVVENDGKFLVQERLKHPYYGFWGFPGGKIRWGETIMQAAARELMEEAGLTASLSYRGVYHEHVQDEVSGEMLEDKIFHIIHGTDVHGETELEFEGGRNAWLSKDEIAAKDKKYKSFGIEMRVGMEGESFVEQTQVYSNQEF
jgi:8-oxo-dGTP pyrophosphatase MutT (NUDIX family)